eukprot:TRINITY_DN6948_c0_g3_i2.p3 TRINITY_DN6948_c0_g3~~TRINITY_DN6948_c0_g3_i2.p3  ORF type:complete len:104 (-),score=29.71 TRINITY_DN6948_c0_g3_i2:30-341(-)
MDEKDLEEVKERSVKILQKEEIEKTKSLNPEALKRLEGSEKSVKSYCSRMRYTHTPRSGSMATIITHLERKLDEEKLERERLEAKIDEIRTIAKSLAKKQCTQ